jgi:hypothetical protein
MIREVVLVYSFLLTDLSITPVLELFQYPTTARYKTWTQNVMPRYINILLHRKLMIWQMVFLSVNYLSKIKCSSGFNNEVFWVKSTPKWLI